MHTPAAVADLPRPATTLDHLSWSALKTFTECPRKFAFRYIENAPEEFLGASLAFGGAFHHAVEMLHQARLEGWELPSTDELAYSFKQHWDEAVTTAPEVRFCKGDDEATIMDLAERMIGAYYAYHAMEAELPDRPQIVGIEQEARFRLLPDAPPIEMRLDLLEMAGDELIVTELKTSRCSWNEQKVRESLPQLLLYVYGLAPVIAGVGAKRVSLKFVVVTKGKTPKVQVLEPTVETADAQRMKEQVAETWTAIQSGAFPRHESWQCAQCPYKSRCLGG